MNSSPFRWIACLALAAGICPVSQGQTYHFVQYSVHDGLPQSQLLGGFQDSRNFLWFATPEAGISRFDGTHFTNFTENEDGLISNYARDFGEDTLGNLWIATENGLGWFDGSQFHRLPDSVAVSRAWINRVAFDTEGVMWVATQNKLYRRGKAGFQAIPIPQLLPRLEETFDLTLWGDQLVLSTTYGVYALPRSGYQYPGRWLTRSVQTSYPPEFKAVHATPSGELWAGSIDGLFHWNGAEFDPLTHPEGLPFRVESLYEDPEGRLWIGTNQNGLLEKQGDQWYQYTTKNGITSDKITQLMPDHTGNLWLITEVGLTKLSGPEFRHWSTSEGLPNALVWSVLADSDSSVWVGYRGGLARWNGRTFELYGPAQGFSTRHPSHMVRDEYGTLWFACSNGLFYYRNGQFGKMPRTQEWQNFRYMGLAAPGNGKLYISGTKAIEVMDLSPGKGYPRRLLLATGNGAVDRVNDFLLDENDILWLATEGQGLAYLLPEGGVGFYQESFGMPSNVVNQLARGPHGDMWAATGSGICRLDISSREPTLKASYSVDKGLLSFNVYSLAWKDSILWLGTDQGVNRLTLEQDSITQIENFGYEEGFRGIEANHRTVSITPEGSIWWGTVAGLTRFQPQLREQAYPEPTLYLEGIDLFYDPITAQAGEAQHNWLGLPSQLGLGARQNTLTFSYLAIALRGQDRLQYRYRLLGQESEWSPATIRQEVRYTNLPPGDYEFQVQASTTPFVWKQLPVTYTFTITPFLWQRPWFLILIGLLSIGMVLGYVRLRLRNLEKARRVLTEKVKARTGEIEHQKQEIETQRDQIETQRDQLSDKSKFLERALEELERNNLQVTSSIQYAKRIQEAILPRPAAIRQAFPQNFILLRPKDIVSGDFYWYGFQGNAHILVVVDCTGHGVPGAIMSMVGHALLNQTILEKGITDPATILKMLHAGVRMALKQDDNDDMNHDGMDAAVLAVYPDDHSCLYAGAKRPLYRVRNGELKVFPGDRFSIGGFQRDQALPFRNHVPNLESGDMLYLTTDGYADQFGGKKNKKFLLSRFKKLLVDISDLPVKEQQQILKDRQQDWMGTQEQTDDMLILGIRIEG